MNWVLGDVEENDSHLNFAAANEGEGIWRNMMMAMGVTHQLLRLSVSMISTAPHQQHYRYNHLSKDTLPSTKFISNLIYYSSTHKTVL